MKMLNPLRIISSRPFDSDGQVLRLGPDQRLLRPSLRPPEVDDQRLDLPGQCWRQVREVPRRDPVQPVRINQE